MHPSESFRFCPSCGLARESSRRQPLRCHACEYVFYFNATCATAAFLERPDGKVLFIRRAKDPAKGRLAIPGGFVDEGETAEEGLRREFMEEVGIAVEEVTFLCSAPNSYDYKGLTYPVLDFFFTAKTSGEVEAQALDAVESTCWLDPSGVDPGEIAFPSMVVAHDRYLEARRAR
jgi:ADP-ribose pyrophosphatase YjhB (NUDIX family)